MAAKKQTVNGIMLGQEWADAIDELAASGHDKGFVMIALNEYGQIRLYDNLDGDNYRVLGVLHMAIERVKERIREQGGYL